MGYPNWRTPDDVFGRLNDEFHFTFDACASNANAKCARYGTPDGKFEQEVGTSGLNKFLSPIHGLNAAAWEGEDVFCNPPYGTEELRQAVYAANTRLARSAVLLLPPNFDTAWADDMWPFSDVDDEVVYFNRREKWNSFYYPRFRWELRIWNGRIRFGVPASMVPDADGKFIPDENDPETVPGDSPRAGNIIAIWHP